MYFQCNKPEVLPVGSIMEFMRDYVFIYIMYALKSLLLPFQEPYTFIEKKYQYQKIQDIDDLNESF